MKKLASALLALLLFVAPLTARAATPAPDDSTPPATTAPAAEQTKPTEPTEPKNPTNPTMPKGNGPLSEQPAEGGSEDF